MIMVVSGDYGKHVLVEVEMVDVRLGDGDNSNAGGEAVSSGK